jgi:DnaJ like chaperone protein
LANLADVFSQTIRSITPEALSELFFSNSVDGWWLEASQALAKSGYEGGDVQETFFIGVFSCMGRLAKVDGRISEREVKLASRVMVHLKLNDEQKRLAIRLFNQGKQPDFHIDAVLTRVYRVCRHRVSVMQVFIETQLQLASADGELNDKELLLLTRMCKRLDVSDAIYKRIGRRVCGANFDRRRNADTTMMTMNDACNLLGVTRFSSQDEVKQTYRRLISQHHPDRVIAQGADDFDVSLATDTVQDLQQAYELVCRVRKFR